MWDCVYRCDGLHAQQQLQRHFEAQFLHKPKDLKAKLLSQRQQQQQTGSPNAGLHWTACMPAARLQREPVTCPSGAVCSHSSPWHGFTTTVVACTWKHLPAACCCLGLCQGFVRQMQATDHKDLSHVFTAKALCRAILGSQTAFQAYVVTVLLDTYLPCLL